MKYREPKVTRTFKTTSFVAVNATLDENGELVKTEKEITLIGEHSADECKTLAGVLAVKNVVVEEKLYGCSASEFLKIAKPISKAEAEDTVND